MSLKGKNRAIFSYSNIARNGSNFMYKDFEKTKSYRSNFKNAIFDYASLRAAHLKFCNFDEASFVETEFIGTNLRDFGGRFLENGFKLMLDELNGKYSDRVYQKLCWHMNYVNKELDKKNERGESKYRLSID